MSWTARHEDVPCGPAAQNGTEGCIVGLGLYWPGTVGSGRTALAGRFESMQLQGNPPRSRTSPTNSKVVTAPRCHTTSCDAPAAPLGCLFDRQFGCSHIGRKEIRDVAGRRIVWLIWRIHSFTPMNSGLVSPTQYACNVPSHRCALGIDGSQSQLHDSVHPSLSMEWG